MPDALIGYLHDGETLRKDVLESYLGKLRKLFDWYSKQQEFRLFASSLLFVYDSTHTPIPEINTHVSPGENDCLQADVRMIDFAHVWPVEEGGRDEGYIIGLTNLINILQSILDEQ